MIETAFVSFLFFCSAGGFLITINTDQKEVVLININRVQTIDVEEYIVFLPSVGLLWFHRY